jgi:hypothetical protein
VVEGARLESVCRGNSTVGSNPTLSATSLTFARSMAVRLVFSHAASVGGRRERGRIPLSPPVYTRKYLQTKNLRLQAFSYPLFSPTIRH